MKAPLDLLSVEAILANLSPAEREAAEKLRDYIKAKGLVDDALAALDDTPPYVDPVAWTESNYYIPETQKPMIMMPHQKGFVRYALDPTKMIQTIVISTIKKSGKTALAGTMGRYLSENSGHRAEVLFIANDERQARGRGYQSAISSIELNPAFNRVRNELPELWKVIQLHAVHIPTNSTMRAIANDYAGEAGANPVATIWTEIWGIKTESSKRLWSELTPVLTRARSLRIVETYAGYTDESEILWDLYQAGLRGRRLEPDEIGWPFPDAPPIYYNEESMLLMYWDTGELARRMPWQQGPRADAYYKEEAISLRPAEFDRLHRNLWVSSVNEFIQEATWLKCAEQLPPIGPNESVVMGFDGSVSNDSTSLVLVTRHPDPNRYENQVAIREVYVWYPQEMGGTIQYAEIEQKIRELCDKYHVVELAYDAFQLHYLATNLTNDTVVWCNSFGQQSPRALADKQFYDLIMHARVAHCNDEQLNKHINNSAAIENAAEKDKLRIVKKGKAPIDATVASSMAIYECLRLNL